MQKKFLLCLTAVLATYAAPVHSAVVTLTVQTTPTSSTTGYYSVFASITNTLSTTGAPGGQVAGISSFSIDILGQGNASITSRTRRAPAGIVDVSDPSSTFGFVQFVSNGTLASGSVTGLGAGQKTAYGSSNDPTADSYVIVGGGMQAGSKNGVSYANPLLIADGAYSFSGAGSITAQLTPGNQFNLLKDTDASSGLQWVGPGNVESATSVISSTVLVPEPGSAMFSGIAGVMLLARFRRRRRPLNSN